MKSVVRFSALVLMLVSAVGAFAVEKSVTLRNTTTVNGQKLEAGTYKVSFEPNGSSTDVKFLKNKKTVATASATVVEVSNSPRETGILTVTDPDGSSKLVGIEFANTKSTLKFAGDTNAGK